MGLAFSVLQIAQIQSTNSQGAQLGEQRWAISDFKTRGKGRECVGALAGHGEYHVIRHQGLSGANTRLCIG
ncbi:hypothetical protein BJX64DRAFT_250852 [Aspergillus heterothallicus]